MISDGKFGREERVMKTGDFRKAYKEGRAYRSGGYSLFLLPNTGPGSRLGISVSARSVRLAVRRNRLKRILREAWRRNKSSIKQGFDIIINVKKDTPKQGLSYKNVERVFLKLASEARLIR
jgi:ribonuclease P protein component